MNSEIKAPLIKRFAQFHQTIASRAREDKDKETYKQALALSNILYIYNYGLKLNSRDDTDYDKTQLLCNIVYAAPRLKAKKEGNEKEELANEPGRRKYLAENNPEKKHNIEKIFKYLKKIILESGVDLIKDDSDYLNLMRGIINILYSKQIQNISEGLRGDTRVRFNKLSKISTVEDMKEFINMLVDEIYTKDANTLIIKIKDLCDSRHERLNPKAKEEEE